MKKFLEEFDEVWEEEDNKFNIGNLCRAKNGKYSPTLGELCCIHILDMDGTYENNRWKYIEIKNKIFKIRNIGITDGILYLKFDGRPDKFLASDFYTID